MSEVLKLRSRVDDLERLVWGVNKPTKSLKSVINEDHERVKIWERLARICKSRGVIVPRTRELSELELCADFLLKKCQPTADYREKDQSDPVFAAPEEPKKEEVKPPARRRGRPRVKK